MSVPAPPYVGRLHGVLAVLPSTRIASVAHGEPDQSFPTYPPMLTPPPQLEKNEIDPRTAPPSTVAARQLRGAGEQAVLGNQVASGFLRRLAAVHAEEELIEHL